MHPNQALCAEWRLHHMGDQVSWQVELAVKPGELDNFRALTREMVESTRLASPGS
jgi:hypothetical protein